MHDENNRRPTQAEAIFAELRRRPGAWVAMPRLYRVSGAFAVHSRIAELRSDGHVIDNHVQRGRRGERSLSFYRLTTTTPISI